MHTLFAYGTLQLPEVMRAVTGREFAARPARLAHYSRHCLRGRSFPGIRPNPGASVDGLVFLGTDPQTLRQLDAFEDSFYYRDAVTVRLDDGSECTAQAYIVREDSYGLLLPEAWSLEDFRRKHLRRFLSSRAGFSPVSR